MKYHFLPYSNTAFFLEIWNTKWDIWIISPTYNGFPFATSKLECFHLLTCWKPKLPNSPRESIKPSINQTRWKRALHSSFYCFYMSSHTCLVSFFFFRICFFPPILSWLLFFCDLLFLSYFVVTFVFCDLLFSFYFPQLVFFQDLFLTPIF